MDRSKRGVAGDIVSRWQAADILHLSLVLRHKHPLVLSPSRG